MIKNIIPLSVVLSLRFFALFIVLPVISLFALERESSTQYLVGLAIGGYALTQILFQIPFGILSDKIGRKPIIIFGLVLFAIGSLVCAESDNIYTLIIGRFIQGAGAVAAVITAMISDLVKEEIRTKAMALMGGSIAASFALAMVLGPILGAYLGFEKLFLFSALLSIISIILVIKSPNPPIISHPTTAKFSEIVKNKNIMKMNLTNFLQKAFMTLAFLIIPIVLVKDFGWEKSELIKVYLPSLVFGILSMPIAAILAEKKGKFKEVLMVGVGFFMLSYLLIALEINELFFVFGIVIFFIGFNMHEPIMQSLASKYVKSNQKGAALGYFNTFGYLGTFIGGVFGGLLLQYFSLTVLCFAIVIISIFWLFVLKSLTNPHLTQNLYFNLNEIKNRDILSHEAIEEYYENLHEKILVVKFDKTKLDIESIKNSLKGN
ncbi:MAG: MFS transporter [Campylobacterales bacterium]|nr:MFS transporter [Campylobacterales bacterium]